MGVSVLPPSVTKNTRDRDGTDKPIPIPPIPAERLNKRGVGLFQMNMNKKCPNCNQKIDPNKKRRILWEIHRMLDSASKSCG